MIRLPILLRRQRSGLIYGALWLPYIGLYQAVNRWPLVEPRVLGMTWLDRAVPFVPELLPLYVAYIPFFWWTVARSEDDGAASRIFLATHLQLLVCVAVWLAFPVAMPRELFYRAEAYGWADAFWRWFDAPNNCLPSLHAANGFFFVAENWRRPWRGLHTAAALAIVASTLLVKQHYAVDVLAGAVLAGGTLVLFRFVHFRSADAAEVAASHAGPKPEQISLSPSQFLSEDQGRFAPSER